MASNVPASRKILSLKSVKDGSSSSSPRTVALLSGSSGAAPPPRKEGTAKLAGLASKTRKMSWEMPKVVPPPVKRNTRICWTGGNITTNKAEALRKFLARKKRQGVELSTDEKKLAILSVKKVTEVATVVKTHSAETLGLNTVAKGNGKKGGKGKKRKQSFDRGSNGKGGGKKGKKKKGGGGGGGKKNKNGNKKRKKTPNKKTSGGGLMGALSAGR